MSNDKTEPASGCHTGRGEQIAKSGARRNRKTLISKRGQRRRVLNTLGDSDVHRLPIVFPGRRVMPSTGQTGPQPDSRHKEKKMSDDPKANANEALEAKARGQES